MKNFWKKLKKPIFILAPMANVTDAAFRSLIAKYGKPNVMWTEFVSADGLSSEQGRKALLIDLKYSKREKPIVAQLFSANPDKMRRAAELCASLGFDGIDINMGCPDRTIEKQGAGAATIKNSALAREIIRAAREGAPELPISVKTRIGYNPPAPRGFGRAGKNEIYLLDEEWIKTLLRQNLAALTVHLRTRKEMSDVPAHWDIMKRILEIRDEIAPNTLIIGNGDVVDLADAKKKVKEFGCDGVMLGRAIFGNPWLFSVDQKEISVDQRLKVMVEHTKLFERLFGPKPAKLVGRTDFKKSVLGIKSFAVMKKHFKAYCNGFDGAKDLRIRLMEAKDSKEVSRIVKDFLKKLDK